MYGALWAAGVLENTEPLHRERFVAKLSFNPSFGHRGMHHGALLKQSDQYMNMEKHGTIHLGLSRCFKPYKSCSLHH